MRNLFVFAAVVVALSLAVGCHGQVPPSQPPTVALTWTASTSCSGIACTYIVSRAVSTGSCPVTSGTAYTPLNQATPTNGTSYTDASPGASNCYIVQAVAPGTPPLTSQPSTVSNGGTPLTVPTVPLAPGPPSATATASLERPVLIPEARPEVSMALLAPSQLSARRSR
jgi:hypothetical protein